MNLPGIVKCIIIPHVLRRQARTKDPKETTHMHVKKLELQGFKSFPDRTKIVLHPGITAVVGPNGTGKSNIVDAFLWVLGVQRLKSLRGDRSEDVIFNGNSQKPPMAMADVSLFLQENEEEIIVSHRLFRSGESEYRLNGKTVRLKDIQDTLWKYSIGEKEYFVIEQGSIGLFLSSKPVEKRGLLEEAAGTSYYKEKKRQAQNKLINSEQNLIRLEDIIIEVTKSKNSLRRQAGAAERYRKTREQIRELTSYHYRARIEELEKRKKEADDQYRRCLDKEKNLLIRLKESEQTAAAHRNEVWAMDKKAKEESENIYSLRSRISRLEADKEKNEVEAFNLEAVKKRNVQSIGDFEQELDTLKKEKTQAEESLKNLERSFSSREKELQESETGIRDASEAQIQWEKKLEAMRGIYYRKLSEQTEVRNERAKVEKELELVQRQEDKLQSRLREEKDTHRLKEQEIISAEKSLSELKITLDEAAASAQNNLKKTETLRASVKEMNERLQQLEEQHKREALQYETLKKWEKHERESETTKIAESPGLLADIIDSTPEYAPLFDILWKEEAKASLVRVEDLLKRLEQKQLTGRFLLLPESSEESPSLEAFSDPRVLGYLKSHLHSPSAYKKNLHRLNDAAVVTDLTAAVDLWLKHPGLDFITMEGEVLLSSGLLKIGEKKEGLFTLARDAKNLEKSISEIKDKIAPQKETLKKEQEELLRAEEAGRKIEEEKERLERSLEEKTKDLEYSRNEEKKIRTNLGLIENEWKVLSSDKKNLEEKQKNIHEKSRILEQEENNAKKNIEEGEEELGKLQESSEQQRRRFFEIKSKRDLVGERIANLKHRLDSIDHRIKGLISRLESLRNEITLSEEKRRSITAATANIEQNIKELEKQKKETESSMTLNESRLDKERSGLKETEQTLERFKENHEAAKEERVKWEIKKAERDRDIANLEEACWQELKKNLEEVKNTISLKDLPEKDIEEELESLKDKIQKLSNVNLMAEEEYQVQKKRHDFLIQQKTDLEDSIRSTREAIKKIDEESKIQFLKALEEVDKNFQDVFSTLFTGGKAGIKLTDDTHPLESGIDIFAQPPGKKVQTISLLSGGEKSLTSLAFFFALFRYKPTPFCILDEVDAALDEVNLTRFLDLMRKMKEQTQFIIVTHNFKTMEVADYIYGTTMSEPSMTQIYSMKMDKKKGVPTEAGPAEP